MINLTDLDASVDGSTTTVANDGQAQCDDPEQLQVADSSLDYDAAGLSSQNTMDGLQGGLKMAHCGSIGSRRQRNSVETMIWGILEDSESSRNALRYRRLMTALIFSSVVITLVQNAQEPPLQGIPAAVVETTIEGIWTAELLARFATSPSFRSFVANAFNVIDVMTIMPLVLRASIGFVISAQNARAPATFILLCIVPFIRLLKTLRRFDDLHILVEAMRLSAQALPIMLFVIALLTLCFSAAIFIVEPEDNIESLGTAMWLTIVTMTTVGYGDVTPESGGGSILVAGLVIISVLFMAMPLALIGGAFNEAWTNRDKILLIQKTRERLTLYGYSAYDIPLLFSTFTNTETEELDFHRFKMMMRNLKIGLSRRRAADLFRALDADGGGSIEAKEFVAHLFPGYYHDIFGNDAKLSKSGSGLSWE